eukprot:gene27504-4813_t
MRAVQTCNLVRMMQSVPVHSQVVCGGCSILLMFPWGAQSVKCSVCNHVTAAPRGGSGAPPAGATPPAAPRKPPTQMVVVENPPTLDEQGNEAANIAAANIAVANIAVGVKSDKLVTGVGFKADSPLDKPYPALWFFQKKKEASSTESGL